MGNDKKSPYLMEEMRVLAGVQAGGVLGVGLEEAKVSATVRHTYDRNKNVTTNPELVLRAVLGGVGGKMEMITPSRMSVDVGAPNVLDLTAFLDDTGYHDKFRYLRIYALNPATNKNDQIKFFKFPGELHYTFNTKSWFLSGMTASWEDPKKAADGIDEVVSQARDFVDKYVKAARAAEPKGSAGLLAMALEINQRLNLRIPPKALERLFAELKP